MKYKPINGWTKARILYVIQKRRHKKPAVNSLGTCTYLAPNGNKCAVGLFIPENENQAQKYAGGVSSLLIAFPQLRSSMPLPEAGMRALQSVHDAESDLLDRPYTGNAKQAMLDWVEENVED